MGWETIKNILIIIFLVTATWVVVDTGLKIQDNFEQSETILKRFTETCQNASKCTLYTDKVTYKCRVYPR